MFELLGLDSRIFLPFQLRRSWKACSFKKMYSGINKVKLEPRFIKHIRTFKVWFGTCNKKLLSVISCLDWRSTLGFETISDNRKMKYAFYFMLKALFVLEIFPFLSWRFGYVEKRFDRKAELNFKIYDVTDWTRNNYNIHIAKHLRKLRPSDNDICSVNKIKLQKSCRKWGRETSSRPLFVF